MVEQVRLVFLGETLQNFDAAQVRRRLGRELRLDKARLAHLFSGQRVVLKKTVDVQRAFRYVDRFARMGARLRVETVEHAETATPESTTATEADRPPRAVPATVPAALPSASAKRSGRGRRGPAPPATLLALGLRGRIARAPYAAASAVSLTIYHLVLLSVLRRPDMLHLALGLPVALVLGFYAVRLGWLRCHDCRRPGAWSIAVVLPVLGLAAAVALSIWPGTPRQNRYGSVPAEGHAARLAAVTAVAALAIAFGMRPLLQALDNGAARPVATRPVTPAGAPTAAAGLAGAAARVYRDMYLPAPAHKAFAASRDGAWGWTGEAASTRDAIDAALAACRSGRRPDAAPCDLVSVDGS